MFQVNAMYSPEMNSIWLPNGIQQREVFGKNRWKATEINPRYVFCVLCAFVVQQSNDLGLGDLGLLWMEFLLYNIPTLKRNIFIILWYFSLFRYWKLLTRFTPTLIIISTKFYSVFIIINLLIHKMSKVCQCHIFY